MLVYFIKFIHIIAALAVTGGTIVCLAALVSKKVSAGNALNLSWFSKVNYFLLATALLAMFTGTFLVYPKNFTFHTPWIQAAYLLVMVFCGGVLLSKFFKSKKIKIVLYSVLLVILVAVTHDAVTKTTMLVLH